MYEGCQPAYYPCLGRLALVDVAVAGIIVILGTPSKFRSFIPASSLAVSSLSGSPTACLSTAVFTSTVPIEATLTAT